jgi:hypothetical protein
MNRAFRWIGWPAIRALDPSIHFEEVTQFLPRIAATEAIGSEHVKRTPHLATKRLDEALHIVTCGNDRRIASQNSRNIALSRFPLRIRHIPARNIPCLARQLIGARQAVDFRGNTELALQDFGGGFDFPQDGAAVSAALSSPVGCESFMGHSFSARPFPRRVRRRFPL